MPKETKLSDDSNSVDNTDNNVADAVNESQPQKLSQSATNSLRTHQTLLTEKAKKKKTKRKKRSEKIGLSDSTVDGISAPELDSASPQLSVVASDESGGVGKRSKKVRNEGQVVRSEDVDGYCGSLPVDDLIEFIDCGRKLWRSRSRLDAGSLTETDKLQSVKKESVKDVAVENDSGFGDTEISERTDGSHSDGALSPSVSSVSESVEIVEILSDLLIPATTQSSVETSEGKLICDVDETTASTISEWTADSELSYSAAFLSDEELAKPESEFTLVQQKKRRTKNQKVMLKDTLSDDKGECNFTGPLPSQNSSIVCSSASSERSNSPQSIATITESTINGFVNHQTSCARGNSSRNGTSSLRRFNSEPKWRSTYPRFRFSPNSSSELHPVHTQTHVSTNPPAKRWLSVNGGKYVPSAASSQQRKVDKMKDKKHTLSAGIPQLPDVIPSAERPRQADKPCLSSVAKVMMQDAHCQTADDDRSESKDQDSGIGTDKTAVPFDLLTLQLFMYHGE